MGILVAFAAGGGVYVGGIGPLATVTVLLGLAAVAYRCPLIIAGLALLQSGDFFNFVTADALLQVRLGSGITLTLLDVLVLVSLPFALLRLAQRHEPPVFTWPVLLVIAAGTVSVTIGLFIGDASLQGAIGLSRNMFYYVMYFVLVAALDSRRKLNGWIAFVLGIMVVACALQLVEALMGHRLSTGLSNAYMYSFGGEGRLLVGGQYSVLYLWNRTALLSFLGLMFALGALVESRSVRLRFVWLAGLGIMTVALAFVRQWFVYVIAGVVGVLLAQRTGKVRGVVITALVGGLVIVTLIAVSPYLQASFGPSFVDSWLARATTIVAPNDQSNYVGRTQTMSVQWESFLQSPVVGHGQTADFLSAAVSSDVGVTNILVEMGLLGLLAVTVLWASFLATALKVRRNIREDVWRGYAVGLVGFWVAVVAGSLFGVNYFSGRQGIWVVVVALALLDRLRALHAPNTQRPLVRHHAR